MVSYFVLLLTVLLSLCKGATFQINWQFGYHGTTNINEGDTVQWNLNGFHDVISDGDDTFPGLPDAQSGGSYQYTFTVAGSYHYFCSIHGSNNMDGTIVVAPATDSPTTSTSDPSKNPTMSPVPSVSPSKYPTMTPVVSSNPTMTPTSMPTTDDSGKYTNFNGIILLIGAFILSFMFIV